MAARLCCAYLRVYQPREALSEADLVDSLTFDRGPSKKATPAAVGGRSLGLIAPQETLEVYEKVVDGRSLVCPAHNRLRALLGLVAFERSIPDSVVSVFFPSKQLARARAELEAIQRTHPEIRPSVVQSVWHVPLRWFACFDDGERLFEQAGDHPTIRYESTIQTARRRVTEALETLSGGIVHPVIVGMMYELKEWLGTFDDDSLLELDYASVAGLFDADELADDHSADDVWNAVRALGDGDGMKAGLYYQRVNERWMRPRQRESLN